MKSQPPSGFESNEPDINAFEGCVPLGLLLDLASGSYDLVVKQLRKADKQILNSL